MVFSLRKNFLKNIDGNFSLTFAIGSMTLMSAVGVAFEINNIEKQNNHLQNALDNAVLAAAIEMDREGQSYATEAEEHGSSVFMVETNKKNYTCEVQQMEVVTTNSKVLGRASCTASSVFPFLNDLMPKAVRAEADAVYGGAGYYEIALMLDGSGSMGGARIAALRDSVNDMIDTLIPASGESNVRISLAPYSSSVNAGIYGDVATGITDLYTHTISNLGASPASILNTTGTAAIGEDNQLLNSAPTGIASDAFSNLIVANPDVFTKGNMESGPVKTTPQTSAMTEEQLKEYLSSLTTAEKREYLSSITDNLTMDEQKQYLASAWTNTDWSDPVVVDGFDWSALGDTYAANVGTIACVTERGGSEAFSDASAVDHPVGAAGSQCPVSAVEPLTDDRNLLHDGVNSLLANGGTAGHLGVAWSWYTLSPEWSDLWAFNRRTQVNDPNKNVKRIAILMTDGAFNAYYETGQGNSNQQSEALCDAMKSDDITIYSIAFNAPTSGQTIMQYCASSDEHYFYVNTADEVAEAYQNIAGGLGGVRISG
ncbi:MAG: VWA domain-containing protein [Maricaulaceae bacterium]